MTRYKRFGARPPKKPEKEKQLSYAYKAMEIGWDCPSNLGAPGDHAGSYLSHLDRLRAVNDE